MKLLQSILLLTLAGFALNLHAQHCLPKGDDCISPFLSHTPCCEGLSCKALQHNRFRCYPQNCIEAFGSCDNNGAPCCEGSCQVDAEEQQVCKL